MFFDVWDDNLVTITCGIAILNFKGTIYSVYCVVWRPIATSKTDQSLLFTRLWVSPSFQNETGGCIALYIGL